MSSSNRLGALCASALALMASSLPAAERGAEQRSLEELRNTVVNLLQALVEKGLMTREQAERLVKQAQEKAAVDAAAETAKNAAAAAGEENAVRVPYVPQIVKDEISKQVAEQVQPAVVASVVQQAKNEKWGVPAALPDWLSRVRVFGDVTFREQNDIYAKDNQPYSILDYNTINEYGGFSKVPSVYAYLDTTGNRNRLRERARLGVEADMSPNWTAVIRLASGSLIDPGSESQTFGTYAERWNVGLDEAYILWNSSPSTQLAGASIQTGRLPNPWLAPTELVYARDLTFEGVASTLRWGWGDGGPDRSHVYLTGGGFPVLEIPLVNQDNKWLVGGQLGTNLRWADGSEHLRLGAAYYDFLHVTGVFNPPNSTFYNFTAPAFERTGNTMFNIADNTTDPTVQLWALAAHFRLADVAATYELAFPRYSFSLTGEAVRNIGYDRTQVEIMSGQTIPSAQNKGYVGEMSFGYPMLLGSIRPWQWRLALGYRYVQSDAVLDAWTDADFHEGGTNTAGYYFWAMYSVARDTWLRLRYLAGNEITGPRYGLDIVQIDLNARF